MPFDIWDQAANTETIVRAMEVQWETENAIGPQIAPLVSVKDRKLKRQLYEIEAFGKGQFKARGATPPIYKPKLVISQEFIELAFLEEMSPIEEDEWHDLTSLDKNIRDRAGVEILTRARILQLRNERLTESMRWAAFRDELIIDLSDDDSQEYRLVYGLPADQKPTAAIPWTDRANSVPISNIRTWQKMLSRRTGHYGTRIHLNSDTYEEFEFSGQVLQKLYIGDVRDKVPTRQELIDRLYENTQIIVTDAGFRDEGAGTALDGGFGRGNDSVTQYIPDGVVMITTDYTIDGERIADVADGRVAVATAFDKLEWKQGMQSEALVDTKAKTYFWRQASARIPRIHRPTAFIWARVYTP